MKRLTRIGAGVSLITTGLIIGSASLLTVLIATLYAVATHWAAMGIFAVTTVVLGLLGAALIHAGIGLVVAEEEEAREQAAAVHDGPRMAYPGKDTTSEC